MNTLFRWTFMPFLMTTALVVGGAWYQTITIVPFWEQDISMFKNYRHWGIHYFPILSPLMTVLWLVLVITSFKATFSNKTIFYVGCFFFLIVMSSTFIYFAPFLLTYMGQPQAAVSDVELSAMLSVWAKWDFIRQVVGLVPLAIFIYTYSKVGTVPAVK